MSDTAPLAALLASHPSEVADALAWLVERSHARGAWHSAAEEQGLTASFDALCSAEIALRGGSFYWLAEHIDGRAIARMGAAAWLRARLPRSDSHRFFDLSNARLHEIAADAMRSAVDEDARKNAYRVRAQADSAVPQSASEYRRVLDSIVARGWPIDVEAEVAAVGGRETETGAQAPKGEQR